MFINIPNNYASAWDDLIYNYRTGAASDLLVEIINSDDDSVIAVKIFYSTSEIKLNISRLIRQKIMPSPTKKSTGFSVAEAGFARVVVVVNGLESEERVFSLARHTLATPTLLTTMPMARILAPNESDSLLVVSNYGSCASVRLLATARDSDDYNDVNITLHSDSRTDEFNIFTLNADDYNKNYQSVELIFDEGSTNQKRIFYSLTAPAQRPNEGYRIAWLASSGSVEYYTFPIVKSAKILSNGNVRYELRSAYGTEREVEALSEIVFSSHVWHIKKNGTHQKIEVLTNEHPMVCDGTLMVASIEIEEYDKYSN